MRSLVALTAALLLGAAALAGEPAPAGPGGVRVLDLSCGSFRGLMTWRTPMVVDADGKPGPLREPRRADLKDAERKAAPVRGSALPPADWSAPAFDDSEWPRVQGAAAALWESQDWRLVCLRGAFLVTDPAAVGELRLNVAYYGGVRVLVNGVEVARGDLPAGDLTVDSPATPYAKEAYLRPDGKLYGQWDYSRDPKMKERIDSARTRILASGGVAGLAVPAKLLRKGLNVIAVEAHAAPISELAYDAPASDKNFRDVWAHVGVASAVLTAPSAAGLVPFAGPTPEVRIGNVAPADTLAVWDFALASEKLAPVRLVGARNGVFSGRVILSSSKPLTGLGAKAVDLATADGKSKIPASSVQVRWAQPAAPANTWSRPNRFDPLLAAPPAQVAPLPFEAREAPAGVAPSALAPVWITVRVPADAAAGAYKGTAVVEAGGARFDVPVELSVADWKVPDPADFTVVNTLWQSPDSVAGHYKVKPWGDEHLKLIGKSLGVLRQLGNHMCAVPLVAHAHGWGNSQGMVRWVKKADGTYDYDFSVAEKYMDVYEKACGKPDFLLVVAWQFPGDNPASPKWPPAAVTVLDQDGKQLEDLRQPPYGTPENEAFWKPVFAELRKRLEKRGWFDNTYISWLTYCVGPDKALVGVVKNIWPDGKWMKNSHAPDTQFSGMPVPVNVWVWGAGALYDPDVEVPWARRPNYFPEGRGAYPQPWAPGQKFLSLVNPRWGALFLKSRLYSESPLMRYRMVAEAATQGNLRGVGTVGGDFWPIPTDNPKRPPTSCVTGEGAVTPRVNILALTSPGPDGADFGCRAEMFREGIQVAEAVIALRKALENKAVGGELAGRIRAMLDERARQQLRNNSPRPVGPGEDGSFWMTGQCLGGWREREAALFALAAEAARVAGPSR